MYSVYSQKNKQIGPACFADKFMLSNINDDVIYRAKVYHWSKWRCNYIHCEGFIKLNVVAWRAWQFSVDWLSRNNQKYNLRNDNRQTNSLRNEFLMFDKKPRYLEVSYRARIWLESLLVLGKLKARNMHYKFKFFTRNPRKNSSQGDRMSGVVVPYNRKNAYFCLSVCFQPCL